MVIFMISLQQQLHWYYYEFPGVFSQNYFCQVPWISRHVIQEKKVKILLVATCWLYLIPWYISV